MGCTHDCGSCSHDCSSEQDFSKKLKWLREPHKARLKKFYYTACILNYLLQTVNPTSPFKTRLIALLDEYKDVVSLSAMGFPEGWKDEDMWKN